MLTDTEKVTLDTDVVVRARQDESLKQRLQKLEGVEFGIVTVSDQELKGNIGLNVSLTLIVENGVWGESKWDNFLWAGEKDSKLEDILAIISNNSFPAEVDRENLSEGQLHQLRDAMILDAHIREGRTIFVSNDKRAFIGRGKRANEKRRLLEEKFGVRILLLSEFFDFMSLRSRAKYQ